MVKDDIDRVINDIDRIVFIEDEVTTGNTIMNIIKIITKEYQKKTKFAVASLLNGMTEEYLKIYQDEKIELHYLVKTDTVRLRSSIDVMVYIFVRYRRIIRRKARILMCNRRRICGNISYRFPDG